MNTRKIRSIETEANYIVEKNATVRQAAKVFGLSKSTLHTDVTKRLKDIDYDLYKEVKAVLDQNKAERHLRGGAATSRKYSKMKGN